MNDTQIASLAHFEGESLERIQKMNLPHHDICRIAGKCFEWAHAYNRTKQIYLKRAQDILNLSDTYQAQVRAERQASVRGAIEDAMGPFVV